MNSFNSLQYLELIKIEMNEQVYSPSKDNKKVGDWSYNVFEGFKYTKRVSWETE